MNPQLITLNRKEINLENTINKAVGDVLARQRNGCWSGDIYYHTYLTASIAIIYKIIGIEDKDWETKAIKVIEQNQRQNGSWGLVDEIKFEHPLISESEAEGSLEIKTGIARNTTTCLLALKLLSGSGKSIEKDEEYVKNHVDMKHVDEITQMMLSYFGGADIKTIKSPPVEIMLIPEFLNQSVEKQIPAWCINSIISALILKAKKSKEFNWSPLRKLAIDKAKKLLIKNQRSNGSWYNVTDPSMHSVLALYECGYRKDDEIMRKGINFLNGQKNINTGYVHRYWYPVWDTALTLMALGYAGLTMTHPGVKKSVSYLLDARSENGAWGICQGQIPDFDDTAITTVALLNLGVEKEKLEPGIKWLLDMQSSDGGWSAYAKNNKKIKHYSTTLEDPTFILKDPCTADVTGHVLHAMGKMGYTISNPKIQMAVGFLKDDQLECGAWYGRWGVCYTYGTSRVLWGLSTVGEDMNSEYVQRATNWLIEHQNVDGGWGEHYMSSFREDLAGIGTSTPTQTGWTLVGLLSLPDPPVDCINKGVKYLYDMLLQGGDWLSTYSVSAIEIYKNTNYDIWPLMALGLYKKRANKGFIIKEGMIKN